MNTNPAKSTKSKFFMQFVSLLGGVAALATLVTLNSAGLLTARTTTPVYADGDIAPPPVPANIEVPTGNKLYQSGHAIGTQQYMCVFNGSSFVWAFFGPQAAVLKSDDKQVINHYLSPNPVEGGTARATWQHSNDGSTVWAAATPETTSSDPNYVAPGAIPWLRLEVKGVQAGPNGGDKLVRTTFIQRLNTSGGIAPSSGCAELTDVGKKALVPYTADYFFYRAAGKVN